MRSTLVRLLPMALLLALPAGTHAQANQPYSPGNKSLSQPAEGFWFGHPGKLSDVTRTIRIDATDDRFQPAVVNVKAGQTVRFEIVDRGTLAHEFVIGDVAEQRVHDKEMAAMPGMPMDDPNGVSVAAGKTATLIWTFTHPATLQYACHVPGHYAAGMFGQLNVHG